MTASEDFIVALDNVGVCIELTQVLRAIQLRINAGEHLGIVGGNGAGKTTLLGLISGELWPAPGQGSRRYRFDNRVHRDAVAARRRITRVSPELQERYFRLGWNFSALEVVLTGLFGTEIPRRAASASQRRRAVTELEQIGAGHLADRPFLSLSHGEQRRVLIARALAFAPALLLLDEPASGLDQSARRQLEHTITVAAARATIVCSAHAPAQLPRITRRVLHLDGGNLTAAAPAEARPRVIAGAPAALPVGLSSVQPAGQPTALVPLIAIQEADVWVAGRQVLAAVHWRLMPGEHWLVTGANGTGKSTFLRLLHGQLRPALGGSMHWPALGDPPSIWSLRRHIGYVSPELQAAYLHPSTVYECVASGLRPSIGLTIAPGRSEQAHCLALIEAFALGDYRNRPVRSLSYGELRRTLLARTLMGRPRILLLDEPWEGLDPHNVALVVAVLRAQMAQGLSIVCASHIGDQGLGLNRSLQIEAGRISVDASA